MRVLHVIVSRGRWCALTPPLRTQDTYTADPFRRAADPVKIETLMVFATAVVLDCPAAGCYTAL